MIGRDHTKKFSPWGIVDRKDIVIAGRTNIAYEMLGIQQLDYYDLFRKFGYTYGAQESYKLDHIAHVVLGERKLSYDEYGSLHTLYKEDYQKFIDYNIKDVELVDRLEAKLDLITLAMTMAYRGGVNYSETFGTTSIWDAIIYRILNKKRIVVPPREDKIKHPYPGAYVKEPQVGMHDWVCSFDLNSLYPNIIVQYNMSPETIIEGKVPDVDVDKLLAGTAGTNSIDSTLAASGIRFRSDKPGIIPDVIRQYYQERVDIKERMLSAKQEYESGPTKKLENEIATLENQQMAIKILMNSLYGALGNNYFRYFDYRIAEAITTTGQLSIRWAERAINQEMNKILKTVDDDYVIAIDTDSLYIRMQGLVDKFEPKDIVKFLDKFCEEHLEKVLERAYADLHELMNSVDNRMVMKREAIADRGIWTAKKRYILNVHNNEGVQYTEPKLKVMGIEAVKSSTPQVCREKLKEIFKVIINGTESDTQKFIADFKKEFCKLAPEDVSFPRGVSDLAKWAHRETIYSKATPIHVRGSLLYNHWVRKKDLLNKYELINQGEKVKYCYLKTPNPIKENVISFNGVVPKEFGLHKHIDYNMMYDKAFVEPLSTILDSIGWSVEPKATLEDFFA
jgi:DNA polymerase elongation subunit (family B)